MIRYIYTQHKGQTLTSGGRNVTYQIYRVIHNKPKYLGEHKANTGAYRGDVSEVKSFIAKKDGYQFDGYRFKRGDIEVAEV